MASPWSPVDSGQVRATASADVRGGVGILAGKQQVPIKVTCSAAAAGGRPAVTWTNSRLLLRQQTPLFGEAASGLWRRETPTLRYTGAPRAPLTAGAPRSNVCWRRSREPEPGPTEENALTSDMTGGRAEAPPGKNTRAGCQAPRERGRPAASRTQHRVSRRASHALPDGPTAGPRSSWARPTCGAAPGLPCGPLRGGPSHAHPGPLSSTWGWRMFTCCYRPLRSRSG